LAYAEGVDSSQNSLAFPLAIVAAFSMHPNLASASEPDVSDFALNRVGETVALCLHAETRFLAQFTHRFQIVADRACNDVHKDFGQNRLFPTGDASLTWTSGSSAATTAPSFTSH
jgi:hypothetical protein